MNQRKLAISLAVVAAIAAPFVSGAYEAEPYSITIVPFSKEREAEIRSTLAETNNCQTNLDRLQQRLDETRSIRDEDKDNPFAEVLHDAITVCNSDLEIWRAGGDYRYDFSQSTWWGKYLALNAAAAAIGFAAIFGLSYLLHALARRYWRWLNT